MIEQTLTKYLTGCIDSAVFYANRPQNLSDLPAVVIELEDDPASEQGFGFVNKNITTDYVVRVWTIDETLTQTLAKSVKTNLDGYRGDMEGTNIILAAYQGATDDNQQPVDSSDRWVYGRYLTFTICYAGD